MKKDKAVVILSGGMDSTVLLYDMIKRGYEVYVLSINYNQKHKKELLGAIKTCKKLNVPHKIIRLEALNELAPSALTRKEWKVPEGHYESENMKQTVVKNRNMVLLSLAAAYAMSLKAKKLFYGAHSGDHEIYPDCRKVFIDKMRECIKLADWDVVELEAPFWNIDKGDIAIRGKELHVDFSLTWTCYKGKNKPCRGPFCGSCSERILAFMKAKDRDPLYNVKEWEEVTKKIYEVKKDGEK